ncbi:MAG: hypothetical protein IPM57_08750 [Oligoflexia bacterium]|nr:hypothetical protein [Oligoflexia bacterium]
MKTKFVVLCVLTLLPLTSFARPGGGGMERSQRSEKPYEPEIVNFTGIVKSKPHQAQSCDSDLKFTVNGSGDVYVLSNGEELKKLHCSKEKDLVIQLKAEKMPRFLFWGGDLKVISFEVLNEQEPEGHILPEERQSSHVHAVDRR